IWDLLQNERLREAVSAAEQFADGLLPEEDLDAARYAVHPYQHFPITSVERAVYVTASTNPYFGADTVAHSTAQARGLVNEERVAQCQLLRELRGNPFRFVYDENEIYQHARCEKCNRRKVLSIEGEAGHTWCEWCDAPIKSFPSSPFRLREFLSWRGGTIPLIAQGIYDERAFER